MARHFSLTTWGPAPGSFVLIRADADWLGRSEAEEMSSFASAIDFKVNGWFSITAGLFGFCACVTYWPGGKPA